MSETEPLKVSGSQNENISEEETNNNNDGIVLKEINGKHSYKTGEVAKMLGESPAMIGHYCREFAEHLNLDHAPGQHRTFNEENIKILRYIIYLLKEEKMSTDQAKEFLSTPQGKLLKKIDYGEDKVNLFIELITTGLKSSIEDIVKKQISSSLSELVPNVVNEIVPKVIEEYSDQISKSISEQQSNIEGSMKELIDKNITSLEAVNCTVEESNKKVANQLTEVEQKLLELRETKLNPNNKKKGFFSRFFK